MYLTKSISSENKNHKMVGMFDAETIMTKKMKLNYTKGKFTKSIISEIIHIISKDMNFIIQN